MAIQRKMHASQELIPKKNLCQETLKKQQIIIHATRERERKGEKTYKDDICNAYEKYFAQYKVKI